MTTGNNEQQPKQKRYVVVDSGFKTYGEYLADKQMREQQALQQQQMAAQGYVFDPRVQQYVPQYDPRYNPYPQHPPQAAYGQQPHPQQYGPRPPHWPVAVSGETAVATIPHPPEKKPRWQPSKRIKVIAGIAVGLVVFGGGTGVAYDTNLGNFQSFVEPINPFDDDSTAGYDSTELKTLSTSSLSHDHCDDADAVILTAYVSGYMPAAPLLPTTENATPTKIPPYLEKEDFPDGPKDPSELKEGEIDPANFVTDSGYPEFYMVDMPLGLIVCEQKDTPAIGMIAGRLSVKRPLLSAKFKDTSGLFGVSLGAAFQNESSKLADAELDEGDFLLAPNPKYKMLLESSDDPVTAAALPALADSMMLTPEPETQLPPQTKVFVAMMEEQAIEQLKDEVDGQDNIHYPEGITTMSLAINKAIEKRTVGSNPRKETDFDGADYNIEMDVAKDPNSKLEISAPDGTTGASALKFLDPNQKFHITNIDVKFGGIKPPETKKLPEPKGTAQPQPTTGP